mmetsp:Transcript_18672/g.33764  ORF Transcript_18672/g.33764 Transcript_18672/m.33764 type:complete len:318 (-) Transcript_18672:1405-2358(-)|eukprot:CAMPEP_0204900960 /NCGR_PEP_ID=MMETSP1397-20131031/2784_1 /ASSEMBLY_ACC=CAM_ASM_000891 /TAXON_ID=49980 /ORGANISM="Climacostomum Climacostomum virens, Strain Stock W-24" /LENGTH=317 /DNA_ID=CAMNT_0052069205 /DNA_START=31 /DNA_END=984 /DNA_ORIENTATION=-
MQTELVQANLEENTLHFRIKQLTKQNSILVTQIEEMRRKQETEFGIRNSRILVRQEEVKKLSEQRKKLEAQVRELERQLHDREAAFKQSTEDLLMQQTQEIARLTDEKLKMRSRVSELVEFDTNYPDAKAYMAKLEAELATELEELQTDVTRLDEERAKATEKLKKDMLYKIKETKQNLLALNEEQLYTTTRLTARENRRLTTELEYHSRQTDKLQQRNSQLENHIQALRQEIEVHKQVETELARRSHFSQRIISKLTEKIDILEKNPTPIAEEFPGLREVKVNVEVTHYLEQKIEDTKQAIVKTQNLITALMRESQ